MRKHPTVVLEEAITYLASKPLDASRRAMAAAWIADLSVDAAGGQ